MGLVDDWTTHHVIFSNPGTAADALAQGRFEQWYGTVNDPRYIMQQMKRNPAQRALTTAPDFATLGARLSAPIGRPEPIRNPRAPIPRQGLNRDWAFSLGTGGGIAQDMFPAKFSFSPIGNPDCINDFMVYGLNVAGAVASDATASGTFSSEPATGTNTVTITVNGTPYAFSVSSSTTNTLNSFARSSTLNQNALNLIIAIGDNSALSALVTPANTPTDGVTLTAKATGGTITFTATSGAHFGTLTSTSGVAQANLVALNELYSNTAGTGYCASPVIGPAVYWAYDGSTEGGTVTTSPVLSWNGKDVIYVESVPSGANEGTYLHILVWQPNTGSLTSPGTITTVSNVGACTSGESCLVTLKLSSNPDTNSSPFYDYINDFVYVGDNGGILYKVATVLTGTPTLSKTLTVDAGYLLTGPVADTGTGGSGYVFVGDTNGVLSAVTASTFSSVAATHQVGNTSGSCSGTSPYNNALMDPPIVDTSAGWVYEYTTDDPSDYTVVVQASTTLLSGAFQKVTSVQAGQGDDSCNGGGSGAVFHTHTPDFDYTYYTGAIKSGHMWVCGRDPGDSANTELWWISTSGTGGALGSAGQSGFTQINPANEAECAPFTEFYNTTTSKDYLFFGEGLASTSPSNSTKFSSFYGYTLSGATAAQLTTVTGYPYATYNGGTSGAVIDNAAAAGTYPEAASIYYTLLNPATSTTTCGTSGAYCAIKVTQAALGVN
jgi:hypothetical protein